MPYRPESDTESDDMPAFEITALMLKAGAAELCLFRLREDRPEHIVEAVYRAMRGLEGKLAPLAGEVLSASADRLVASPSQHGANQQALGQESASDAVWSLIQELKHPSRGE